MSNPQNQTAVVTGAASGIGLACARRLAQNGNAIAIWDINEAGAQAAVAALNAEGFRAMACKVDVSKRADVDAAAAAVRAKFGPVRILVNNAGMTDFRSFLEVNEDLWDRIMSVNLKSMWTCSQALLADMLEAKWGRIVNVSSSSAQTGAARMVPYAASKGGVIAFTKAMAAEFAASGITVNNVPPGFIDTPMLRAGDLPAPVEVIAANSPMKRAGKPEDIAAAVAFLASDEAGYITGHTLSVNGGRYSS